MAATTPLPDLDRFGTDRLWPLVGVEHGVGEVARALHGFARACGLPRVGAMLVTCADESEQECADALRHGFIEPLLPSLKFRQRAPFRLANLGSRYEWGAVAIAEQHFAAAPEATTSKLLLIKLNAHVGCVRAPGGPEFGRVDRYGAPSVACGALDAVMEGSCLPVAGEIAEALRSEGRDRLAALADPALVDPRHRSLFAALCHARLQARRALVDLQDSKPASPTVFVVVPSVTLNRDREDGEIVCGAYLADWRGERPRIAWAGLDDDPAGYRLETSGRLRVTGPGIETVRAARDHRRHVEALRGARAGDKTPAGDDKPADDEPADGEPADGGRADGGQPQARAELAGAARRARSDGGGGENAHHAAALLKLALHAAAQLDPVTAALALFAEGAVGIHHLFRAHRLARHAGGHAEAMEMLQEIEHRVDGLPPRRARELVALLAARYGAG